VSPQSRFSRLRSDLTELAELEQTHQLGSTIEKPDALAPAYLALTVFVARCSCGVLLTERSGSIEGVNRLLEVHRDMLRRAVVHRIQINALRNLQLLVELYDACREVVEYDDLWTVAEVLKKIEDLDSEDDSQVASASQQDQQPANTHRPNRR
jgi:hypothetical protein